MPDRERRRTSRKLQRAALRDLYFYCFGRTQAISDSDATYLLERLGVRSGRDTEAGRTALRRESRKLARSSELASQMADTLREYPGAPEDDYSDHEQSLRAAHLLCSQDFYEVMLLRKRYYRKVRDARGEHMVESHFAPDVRKAALPLTFDKLLEKIDREVRTGNAKGPTDTFRPLRATGSEGYERGWLIRCMHDRCADAIKRRNVHNLETIDGEEVEKLVDHPDDLDGDNPEGVFDDEAMRRHAEEERRDDEHAASRAAWDAINQMSEMQHEVFSEKYGPKNGTRRKTNREVAEALGIPVGDVEGYVHHGILNIRHHLREVGYDIPA